MKEITNKTKIQYLVNSLRLFNHNNEIISNMIVKVNEEEKECLEQFIEKNNKCIEISKKKMIRVKKLKHNEEYNIYDFNYFYKLINGKEKFNVNEYNKKWRINHKDYYNKYYEEKLKDNLIHCDICNKNVISLYFENHKLKPAHIKKFERSVNSNNQMIV